MSLLVPKQLTRKSQLIQFYRYLTNFVIMFKPLGATLSSVIIVANKEGGVFIVDSEQSKPKVSKVTKPQLKVELISRSLSTSKLKPKSKSKFELPEPSSSTTTSKRKPKSKVRLLSRSSSSSSASSSKASPVVKKRKKSISKSPSPPCSPSSSPPLLT